MLGLATRRQGLEVASALDPTIRSGCPTSAQAEKGLKSRHRLLSAIVAENKLIEVRLELTATNAMMGTNQPVLEVADDTIGEWHDRLGSLAQRRPQGLLQRDVPISSSRESGERPEAITVDRRASRDGGFDEGAHRCGSEVWQDDEADATRPIVTTLNRNQHRNRAPIFELTASFDTGLRAANPRVIEFDLAMERFPCRVHHRSAEFVEHQPGGFIATQPELTLDEKRGDATLVGGHQIRRPKPLRQRRLGVVENRAGRERYLMSTLGALPPSMDNHVGTSVTAAGTDEAIRPATGRQIFLAGLFGCELASEFVQILRKSRTRHAPTLQIVAG